VKEPHPPTVWAEEMVAQNCWAVGLDEVAYNFWVEEPMYYATYDGVAWT
jgi:hypothetical protein